MERTTNICDTCKETESIGKCVICGEEDVCEDCISEISDYIWIRLTTDISDFDFFSGSGEDGDEIVCPSCSDILYKKIGEKKLKEFSEKIGLKEKAIEFMKGLVKK